MKLKELTKKQWLKRCETVYEVAQSSDIDLHHLYKVVDAVMRFEGGQTSYFVEFMEEERKRTDNFSVTLANDKKMYALIYMTSIFSHPCQECAEDTEAWHTRPAFCKHKN